MEGLDCSEPSFLFAIITFSFIFLLFHTQPTNLFLIIPIMEVIVMENKYLLSVSEASKLYGIGQHRMREIIREDYNCKYHLMIGRVIKIKKQPFELFLNNAEQI